MNNDFFLENQYNKEKILSCLEKNNKKKINFNIQGLTRLSDDNCYIDYKSNTIQKPFLHIINNFHDCRCLAPNVKQLSLEQPNIIYKDGYGWTSIKGCNIDNDSRLRNARNLTNIKCKNQLFQRPYNTIPYMGRGEGDICVENKLLPGEDTFQNRPCNNLAGINIDRFIPQIPCIKENIQNPINIIPEENNLSWIRGGQPSRQVIRDKDYLKKCGLKYNGKYWGKEQNLN